MNTKQILKIGVDILMTAALLLLMAYELVGQAAHEWIGGTFSLFLRIILPLWGCSYA